MGLGASTYLITVWSFFALICHTTFVSKVPMGKYEDERRTLVET